MSSVSDSLRKEINLCNHWFFLGERVKEGEGVREAAADGGGAPL